MTENHGEDAYFKEIYKWVRKDARVKKCFVRDVYDLIFSHNDRFVIYAKFRPSLYDIPEYAVWRNGFRIHPVSFISREEKECVYEAHKKYMDIHYIMEGAERIATADVRSLQVETPYSEENTVSGV